MHIVIRTNAEHLFHNITTKKYVIDSYNITILQIDDSYIDICIKYIWKHNISRKNISRKNISRKNISRKNTSKKNIRNINHDFIVISENYAIITKCHTRGYNALIQHVNKSFETTLDYAIHLLNHILSDNIQNNLSKTILKTILKTIPSFSYHNNKMRCPAGILPMIHHNGEYFTFLGTDKYTKKSSDFGGKFDKVYEWKGTDDILGSMQIKTKRIDPTIMSNYYYMNDDKNKQYVTNILEYVQTKQIDIAIGDIDTKYTAFREFMEESNYVNPNGTNGYYFEPDVIHKKLYIDHSYMYLGGTQEYNYDMYVLFFVMDDLSPVVKRWFIDAYGKYTNITPIDPMLNSVIMNDIISNENLINNQYFLTIPRNAEMCGMKMIPLTLLVTPIDNINYDEYIEKRKEYSEMKKKERGKTGKCKTGKDNDINQKSFFVENYGSSLLETMRVCFVDALVRYKTELNYLVMTSHNTDLTKALFKYLSLEK